MISLLGYFSLSPFMISLVSLRDFPFWAALGWRCRLGTKLVSLHDSLSAALEPQACLPS